MLTIINANQRAQLRLFYKNKKHLPLDLRPKHTRAIRRRLNKHERTRVSEKGRKKAMHFPARKYAVKVCNLHNSCLTCMNYRPMRFGLTRRFSGRGMIMFVL